MLYIDRFGVVATLYCIFCILRASHELCPFCITACMLYKDEGSVLVKGGGVEAAGECALYESAFRLQVLNPDVRDSSFVCL
jgi:hypothetical protein